MTGADESAPGYVAMPREMLIAADKLPRDQGWLLERMARDARWQDPGPVIVRGGVVTIDTGEQLISLDGLAKRYEMTVAQVRRALATFERKGWISRRPAAAQTGTPLTEGKSAKTGTPPTVVRFEKWRDILWPKTGTPTGTSPGTRTGTASTEGRSAKTGTPTGTSPGTRTGTILQDQQVKQSNLEEKKKQKTQPAAAAPAAASSRKDQKAKEPVRPLSAEQLSARDGVVAEFDAFQIEQSGYLFHWTKPERDAAAEIARVLGPEWMALFNWFKGWAGAGETFFANNFRPRIMLQQVNRFRTESQTRSILVASGVLKAAAETAPLWKRRGFQSQQEYDARISELQAEEDAKAQKVRRVIGWDAAPRAARVT